MKTIFSIFVVSVIVIIVRAAEKEKSSKESEEFEKFITEQAKICQKENKATDDDLKALLEGAEPTTKMGKCMNGCLMSKLGMINDANKLVPEKLTEIVEDNIKSKDGITLKSTIKDLVAACNTVTDSDKCEVAVKLLSCLNVEAQKRGFDKNVF